MAGSVDSDAFMVEMRERFDEAMRADKENRDRSIEDAEF